MLFSVPGEPYQVDPVAAEALDLLFILHADHEQNASTSTVRLAGSSGTNPYAAIAAGIATLWGPAHGGANEAVLAMLEEIGSVKNIRPSPRPRTRTPTSGSWASATASTRTTIRAPRSSAPPATRCCRNSAATTTRCSNSPCAWKRSPSRTVLHREEALPERGLLLRHHLQGAQHPVNMFTVMFAIARTVGWVAHWQEMIAART